MAFTLYPPGHVPYGRSALAPVAPDGGVLQSAPSVEVGEVGCAEALHRAQPSTSSPDAFSNTIFDAALDAARGVAWKHAEQLASSPDGCDRWWSTQQRHLLRATKLVGVDPSLTIDVRLQVAEALSVPALVLIEAAGEFARSAGYIACGSAVLKVLSRIPRGAYLAERIAESGFLVSLWAEPLRWDPRRRCVQRKPFQPLRTRGPPSLG